MLVVVMLKQKLQKLYPQSLMRLVGVSVIVVIFIFGSTPTLRIEAESIQEQIAMLEKENAENKKLLEDLKELVHDWRRRQTYTDFVDGGQYDAGYENSRNSCADSLEEIINKFLLLQSKELKN